MEVAFFTEMGFNGKVPRTHNNMRTEFAWMVALNADHYNINQTPNKKYDLGITIIPKNNPQFDLKKLKKYCDKVAVMQEGPHWYFQDYSLEKQINYFNTLTYADIIFVHNNSDKKYYSGLTEHKDIRVMKSLMIEDAVGELKEVERKGIIIGGNFVSWYGGFDSYIVASSQYDKVFAPSMGRKQEGEEQMLSLLPYMSWKEWIHKLNEFKIGVHLMRTHAAGTFALNCAYLGIPCIGYKGLDTQEICHPDLTVDIGDLTQAKKLLERLKNDEEFYLKACYTAQNNHLEYYHENKFKI
jgi:hypothetical protein|tara:strand:+ start:37 stop:927 length:891 start_codon:yes stop_codon:yes gene_type:complete